MNLRPYQDECIDSVMNGFQEFDRQLVVAPTGSGKTILFAHLAKRIQPKKTLILAHRDELINQAVDKIQQATGIKAEIEKAEQKASPSAPIIVASIQSLRPDRLSKWSPTHFDLVVADEAHHALADSWQSVLNYFKSKTLGVTATPHRGDKKNLGRYFENIAYEIGLLELIKQKYLSPISIRSVPINIDLSNVKQSAGDFDAEGLGLAIAPYFRSIVESIKVLASNRKILVFLPLIKTSQVFVETCNELGIKARHIDGNSPDRREILEEFKQGKFQLLSNAMLLTEGYDEPSIDCVVMLRPTRSQPLYAQAVGRGTRIHPGKTNLLLLDFLWLHEKHNLIRPAHLVAGNDQEALEITDKTASGEEKDLINLKEEVQQDRENKLAEELSRQKRRQGRIFSIEEIALAFHNGELVEFESTMDWHALPTTSKQIALLQKFQIATENIRCRGHAAAILDKIFKRRESKLATLAQVRWLKKMGHPTPDKATFSEAATFLDSKWNKKAA